uniref:Uncharacterized protein n=1 Tax=Siphoviridae sp. ctPUt3 TaxID=2825485 RepID=A0A8S5U4N7_9CAUD|nr:MAG TPA: hypothetical protein [Siphoviridae sp. ctPUt3]
MVRHLLLETRHSTQAPGWTPFRLGPPLMPEPAMRNLVHTRHHTHPSSAWLRGRATLTSWL